MKRGFVIGTRHGELAGIQAALVRDALAKAHPGTSTETVIIKTAGDAFPESPIIRIGAVGVFTTEIEEALLSGHIDIAVHSLKDLPTELPAGLSLGAVTRREDPRDVFLPNPGSDRTTIASLPPGSIIATGSPRRRAQILGWNKGFTVEDLRGNLPTRWNKLAKSRWAGIILARAGVARLGWLDRVGETLEPEKMLPAVGQGALGIEIRAGDSECEQFVACLDHAASRYAATAERSFLRVLEGGCKVPAGAHAAISANVLTLSGLAASPDGSEIIRGRAAGKPDEAADIGRRLAETLLESGAERVLRAARAAIEAAPFPSLP